MENTQYSRNKLITTLLKIGHGDLSIYVNDGLLAASAEPELLAHFVAWNDKNGKVRDSKVAFPIIALRGVTKNDTDLAQNAVAHLLKLSPRDLVRAYDFNKKMTAEGRPIPAGFRRLLEQGLKMYLTAREANNKWFDKVTLQHRHSMKRLYRLSHQKPGDRAQKILFDQKYPRGHVLAKVAKLNQMPPKEAAGVILNNHIPFEVIVGAGVNLKEESIALAILEGMSGNQVITNTKMLERMGVQSNPILKTAYEQALERAKTDKKVETLKAGRAAEKVTDKKVAEKLAAVQSVKTAQLGSINGDWLVLGDASGSMRESIELARKLAAFIAERVAGAVYLVFFNTSPTFYEVSGKSYDDILKLTGRIMAGGGTSVGCGLDYLRSKGTVINGIAIASDGGDNSGIRFHDAYTKYVAQLQTEPTVYFYRVPGDPDQLTRLCEMANIQVIKHDLGANVDYYSLPNLVATMRANRYSLVDEILETPLLTFNDVFNQKEI